MKAALRAANAIAVMHALAAAKAQVARADDREMWWGVCDLTERALADVNELATAYDQAADRIHDLETAKPCGGAR